MSTRRNVGEIIKRGRIYYIRYYDLKGRRRLETTKSTDRNEAEKQLRKRLSAKDAGVSPDAAVGKLTLKEATDDLFNDYKVNGRRSLPEVRRKVELHLLPYFGERRRMMSIPSGRSRWPAGAVPARADAARTQHAARVSRTGPDRGHL